MRKPRGRHRRSPYYKVQMFNQTSMTWQDERKVSASVAEAEQYIAKKSAGRRARIIVVEEADRRILTVQE